MSIEVLVPDPEVLIMGLRDTGYDSNTAIADVVDNSVDAGASCIKVSIQLDVHSNPSVMIADNGCGMNRDELIDGMKYGSSTTYEKDPKRLGKFGLGLKTASTAFCKRFSVLSRASKDAPIYMATWDLDKVARDKAWNLEIVGEKEIPQLYKTTFFNITGPDGHGTLVVWEKIDRFPNKKGALDKIVNKFSDYASLIYHRFLDKNDTRARTIEMSVNGKKLEPNDPFCLREMREDDSGTIIAGIAKDKECTVLLEDGTEQESTFHLQGYILPVKENFSSKESLLKANVTNHNMGFYVYRENRMIASGDWLGLRKSEPHDSLYRAEFSFDHTLDVAFKIDVKKSRIELEPDLGEWLANWSVPGIKMAEERYRRKTDERIAGTPFPNHEGSDKIITEVAPDVTESVIEPVGEVQSDGTQKVEVTNANTPNGPVVISITVPPDDDPGVSIKISDNVKGGALWEPTYKDGCQSVIINTSHPFYQKVYYPLRREGVAVSGLDDLLWSLACAEFGIINDNQKKYFKDFRMKVSSILEALVENLPDPDID